MSSSSSPPSSSRLPSLKHLKLTLHLFSNSSITPSSDLNVSSHHLSAGRCRPWPSSSCVGGYHSQYRCVCLLFTILKLTSFLHDCSHGSSYCVYTFLVFLQPGDIVAVNHGAYGRKEGLVIGSHIDYAVRSDPFHRLIPTPYCSAHVSHPTLALILQLFSRHIGSPDSRSPVRAQRDLPCMVSALSWRASDAWTDDDVPRLLGTPLSPV